MLGNSRLRWVDLLVAGGALLTGCGGAGGRETAGSAGGAGAPAGGSASGAAGPGGRTGAGAAGGLAGAASEPEAGAAGASGGPGGSPGYPGAPRADTEVADQVLDVFGVVGNRYWFGISPSEVDALNQRGADPAHQAPDATHFADHLWITAAGAEPRTADYGKVQVKVVGQSTWRPWLPSTDSVPSLNVDADRFVDGQRIGGHEHLRFDNNVIGGIFRERFSLEVHQRLGYVAASSSYAWVSSSVWAADTAIPYTIVERYKQGFCDRNALDLGGGCANMWEMAFLESFGAAGTSPFDDPENCRLEQCDGTRANELGAKLSTTPQGEGFAAALVDYVDWPALHRFQCLAWILQTSDDTLHSNHNVVFVEREDGKFQYLPYSIDISLDREAGGAGKLDYTPLTGVNELAAGCQRDPSCWSNAIAECENAISEFTVLDPNGMLEELRAQLDAAGMLREGDQARYEATDAWLTRRVELLPRELELFRNPHCDPYLVDCQGQCVRYEECPL